MALNMESKRADIHVCRRGMWVHMYKEVKESKERKKKRKEKKEKGLVPQQAAWT